MSKEYRVIYGHQLLNFKDNDHYHTALKASHVLLEEGRLKKYSIYQEEMITVHGIISNSSVQSMEISKLKWTANTCDLVHQNIL